MAIHMAGLVVDAQLTLLCGALLPQQPKPWPASGASGMRYSAGDLGWTVRPEHVDCQKCRSMFSHKIG